MSKESKTSRFRFAVALNREGKKVAARQQVDDLLVEYPEHAKAWALKSTMEKESRHAVATAEKGYAARPDLAVCSFFFIVFDFLRRRRDALCARH